MTKTANLSLSDFDSVSTTSMEIKAYGSNDSTGAFIEGFTPDSPEWRAIRRKQAKNKQPTKLMLGKKANFIELEQSEGEHSEEDLMLIEVITDIKGIAGYKFTKESAKELLLGNWHYILDQWREHLDDRSNFLQKAGSTQKSG